MSDEAVMLDLFDRWERVWHEDRHELIPGCLAPVYLRHDATGDRAVSADSYTMELAKLKAGRPGIRVAVYDHAFAGSRAWFRFTFKWRDPKTGETVTQAGMQSGAWFGLARFRRSGAMDESAAAFKLEDLLLISIGHSGRGASGKILLEHYKNNVYIPCH